MTCVVSITLRGNWLRFLLSILSFQLSTEDLHGLFPTFSRYLVLPDKSFDLYLVFFYLNFPDWAYFHIWMIWLFRSPKDGSTQPVQLAIPPARLAPYLFPPVPVKSISSWSFTWSLSLPSCFYSWQSPLLEFIQHVCGVFFFFFGLFKISMCVWSIICQALFQAAGIHQCTKQTKISAFMEQTSLSRCFSLPLCIIW